MKQFEWMERFKIRGTYGITGKVDFSPYEAQTIYQVITDNWFKNRFRCNTDGIGEQFIGMGEDA